MPLIGINPVSETIHKSKLEKILEGVQIAQGILGLPLGVMESVQKGKIANLEAGIKQPELGEQKVKTAVEVAKSTREPRPGETGIDIPGYGSRIAIQEHQANPYAEEDYKNLLKSYDRSEPGEPGAQEKTLLNGQKVYIKPKTTADPEVVKDEQFALEHYSKQAEDYMDQKSAFKQIMNSDNNYAGVMRMVRNYAVLSTPQIKRMGAISNEDALASANISDAWKEQIKKLQPGTDIGLPETIFKDFKSQSQKAMSTAIGEIQGRRKFWSDYAQAHNLNVKNIIPEDE